MRRPLLMVLGLAAAWPAFAAAEGPVIEHVPVGCVVAGQFPRFDALVASPAGVARAVVRFRPDDDGRDWYAIAMKPLDGKYAAFLPRPQKSLKAFRYYIEATDTALGTSQTAEFVTNVVPISGACRGKFVAATVASASVLIEVPAGVAVAVPAGFTPLGVTTTVVPGAATGTVAAGSGAATAGGIGIGTVLLVGGGVAAAGAAVAVASVKKDEDGSSDEPGGRPIFYDLNFGSPEIDVSSCFGVRTTFCCQNVGVKDGSFNEVWQQRVVASGRASDTSLTGTVMCISGGPTGSLSASGSGGNLQGTWEFAGSRGTLTVRGTH